MSILQAPSNIFFTRAALAWIVLTLIACNNSTPTQPTPAVASRESFTQIGDFQLHYNTVSTHTLPSNVAKQYGIQQSKQRALIIISVLQKNPKEPGFQPVAAQVTVTTRNLIDQTTPISMRRVDAGHAQSAISYIGEIDVKHRQILFFEIKAIPTATSQLLAAKFQQEFFVD